MRASVVVNADSSERKEGRLREGGYLIGRSRSCQIRPTDRSVSRRHCLLIHHGDSLSVMDLGSTAGTFINDVPLEPGMPTPLCDADQLRLGSIELTIVILAEETPSAPRLKTNARQEREETKPADESDAPIPPMLANDVADWLTNLDESDRRSRIQSIREKANAREDDDALATDSDPSWQIATKPPEEAASPTPIPPASDRTDKATESTTRSQAKSNTPRDNRRSLSDFIHAYWFQLQITGLALFATGIVVWLVWLFYAFFAPGSGAEVIPGV